MQKIKVEGVGIVNCQLSTQIIKFQNKELELLSFNSSQICETPRKLTEIMKIKTKNFFVHPPPKSAPVSNESICFITYR